MSNFHISDPRKVNGFGGNKKDFTPKFAACIFSLVETAKTVQPISGDVVAIDASAITAYEKSLPKKDIVNDGSHANWGAKLDTNGNQHTWFGYKVHLAIDTQANYH